MNYFRKCCSRIIRQVRISRKAKRHVVRRHFLPKATGRVSVFSHKLSPNDVFQTTLNKLRSRQLQGKIHYKRCPRSSWNLNLSRVEGSNVFQEFEEASQKAISTEYNIYIVCRPLGMEVSPLSSWSGNLWVATFSEWPWNFWKRLPSRRWIVNIDFIQILENCSC